MSEPRDFKGEFDYIVQAETQSDPTFSQLGHESSFDGSALQAPMAALLRRSEFLHSFMELYPPTEDDSGYSHRSIVGITEGLTKEQIPTEQAAIAAIASVNNFIDEVLLLADMFKGSHETYADGKYEEDLDACKLDLASEAWFSNESVAAWLVRVIDTAFQQGVQVSAIPPEDVHDELFLLTGETAEQEVLHEVLQRDVRAKFMRRYGEKLFEILPVGIDSGEMADFLVGWGFLQANASWHAGDERLTQIAKKRFAENEEYTEQSLIEYFRSLLNGVENAKEREVLETVSPFIRLLTSVGFVGIKLLIDDDQAKLDQGLQTIASEWFRDEPTDEEN